MGLDKKKAWEPNQPWPGVTEMVDLFTDSFLRITGNGHLVENIDELEAKE